MSVVEVLAMVSGWIMAALGGGVALSRWLVEVREARLHLEKNHEHQDQLEERKSGAAVERDLLGAVLGSLANGSEGLQQHRVEAVRVLWEAVFEVKGLYTGATFIYNITVPDDYDDILDGKSQLAATIRSLSDEPSRRAFELESEVFATRPFLNSRLWLLWWAYRAVHGRANHILVAGAQHGKVIHWTQDAAMKQIVGTVLSARELEEMEKQHHLVGLLSAVINHIEVEMLAEVDKLLTGRGLAEAQIREARLVANQLASGQQEVAAIEAAEGQRLISGGDVDGTST